jgi:hypothetical protein
MRKKTSVPADSENHLVVFQEKAIRRDKELAKGWGQIATPLRIETEGGIQRLNCANTEGELDE